jgi:hypothetical protein
MHRLAAPWHAAFNAKPYPGTHRVPHTRLGGGSGGESYPPAGMEAGGGGGERCQRRVWRYHTRLHTQRVPYSIDWRKRVHYLTRVNSTNVLNEGLRIGEIRRRMNSKVKLVEIGVCRE